MDKRENNLTLTEGIDMLRRYFNDGKHVLINNEYGGLREIGLLKSVELQDFLEKDEVFIRDHWLVIKTLRHRKGKCNLEACDFFYDKWFILQKSKIKELLLKNKKEYEANK